jgi:hypothetical protein
VTGITPDILVENLTAEQIASREQREIREENLRGHFNRPGETPPTTEEKAPEAVEKKEPESAPAAKESEAKDDSGEKTDASQEIKEGELGKDPQLDRALQVLKSWESYKKTHVATAAK